MKLGRVLPGLVVLAACSQPQAREAHTAAAPLRADRPIDFVLLDPQRDDEPVRGRLAGADELPVEAQLDEVIVRSVAARPGQTVADVGCGGGRHALRIAGQVGAAGQVYCRDLSAGLIEGIREQAEALGRSNIDAQVSLPEDAGLPAAGVDVILLADVYGLVAYQQGGTKAAFVRSLFQSLKPGGLAVVCFVRSVRSRRAEVAAITDADFLAAGFEPGRRIRFDTLPGEPLVLDYWHP